MIRTPAVAGSFYPADPRELETLLGACLPDAPPSPARPVIAALAPHAGWIYSGRVAGMTYARIAVPRRVILLGPNHAGLGEPLALWDRGRWDLPDGSVEVDEDLCDALKAACPGVSSDRRAHLREHCLEVQIPFLRRRSPAVRIAPIVVGTSRLETLRSLGGGIASVVRRGAEPVLIILSSDMTHYEPADAAAAKDRLALERMEALDPEGLHRVVLERRISMCGFAPAVAGLFAARDLGARSGEVIAYAHSGEVNGDNERVVGYAGMVFA